MLVPQMFKERFIIAISAVFLGLSLTGGAFYVWQSTKIIQAPNPIAENSQKEKPATPQISLTIESPADESVVDKRIIPVSGVALGAQNIIVSTDLQDLVVEPASDGSFSLNITLSQGVNPINVIAIMPNNEIARQTRTVTFTTEAF